MTVPVLLDGLQWMALAYAIADERFATRLHDEVGPRAFPDDSLKGHLFDLTALHLAEVKDGTAYTAREKFLEALGVKRRDGEKMSDTILRVLRIEAEIEWKLIADEGAHRSFVKAQKLVRIIHRATAQLLEMARADDWRQECKEAWEQEQRARIMADKAILRTLAEAAQQPPLPAKPANGVAKPEQKLQCKPS